MRQCFNISSRIMRLVWLSSTIRTCKLSSSARRMLGSDTLFSGGASFKVK